jgi:hypothetical protein
MHAQFETFAQLATLEMGKRIDERAARSTSAPTFSRTMQRTLSASSHR